jgi:hypothetical protein
VIYDAQQALDDGDFDQAIQLYDKAANESGLSFSIDKLTTNHVRRYAKIVCFADLDLGCMRSCSFSTH